MKEVRGGNNSLFHNTISSRLQRTQLGRVFTMWGFFLFLLLCFYFSIFFVCLFAFLCLVLVSFGVLFPCYTLNCEAFS